MKQSNPNSKRQRHAFSCVSICLCVCVCMYECVCFVCVCLCVSVYVCEYMCISVSLCVLFYQVLLTALYVNIFQLHPSCLYFIWNLNDCILENHLGRIQFRAQKTAQSAMGSPCKHNDLSSGPRHPYRMHARGGGVHWESRHRTVPALASQPSTSGSASCRVKGDIASNPYSGGVLEEDTCMCTYVHMYCTHRCTRVCTQAHTR